MGFSQLLKGFCKVLFIVSFFFSSVQVTNFTVQVSANFAYAEKNDDGSNSNNGNGGNNGNNNNNHDKLTKAAQATFEKLQSYNMAPSPAELVGIAQFNNPVIIEVLIWRIHHEAQFKGVDVDFVVAMVESLNHLLTQNNYDIEIVAEKTEMLENIRRYLESSIGHMDGFSGYLKPILDNIVKISKRTRIKLNLNRNSYKGEFQTANTPGTSLIVPEPKEFQDPEQKLEKFKKFLENRIIEQPEVINSFYELEFETLVKGAGNTREPPFFYLMGLPGVGKDTSADAYIDALFGSKSREHLFQVPLQKSASDAWSLMGSSTGYIGSNNLSPFIKFLVEHSNGKYIIKEETGPSGKGEPYVVENPDYKGKTLRGYFPSEKAVVFLNEFHNWSSVAKAIVLKESLEKGRFKINNPGKGVHYIEVPGVRFIAASNEGIELYTNRDVDGSRYGEPLSYEEMMQRWEKVAHDKDMLKQTIAKTASKNPPGTPHDQQVGMPEEMLSRIHPSRLILMRPISPEGLRIITQLKVDMINDQLFDAEERGVYGKFEIKATSALIRFVQEYDYISEDGARPVADKVRSLLEYPMYQAFREGKFKPEDVKDGVTLDIKRNEDKTYSLVVIKGLENATEVLREQPIHMTFKEREFEPITDEKIDRLADIDERLKDQVFGAEKAIEKISQAILLSAEVRHSKKKKWSDHDKATSFAFFGPSSTGKSEMAKAVVRELFPDYGEQRRVDIDFNKIQTTQQMEEFIWGRKDGNRAVPSEFMKKYDQFNGDILFVFEEGTNTPRQLLKSLYDLFRENHPKFSDGKDRPMTNVTIIITGNAGIEWYTGIPKNLPDHVRMAAWSRVYKEAMKNPGMQRETVDKYLPEPLTNRIGEQNIIWFAPLTFKAVRELSLSKLNSYISKMKVADGRRGWDVGFRNADEHTKFVELIEREGFVLEEQGASIDRFADAAINKSLRALLLKNKVATGARVALVARDDQTEDVIKENEKVLVDVVVEGTNQKLTLELDAKKRGVFPKENENDRIMTAVHEAGHEFVGRTLLGDKHKSTLISIIPGVGEINGKMIYWLGVRMWEEVERLNQTPEAVVRRIAGLLAGAVAQDIFSKGARSDAGKSNDIEQATKLAQTAVGKWGLSEVWGNRSIKDLHEMSGKDREVFNSEVERFLKEGKNLAFNLLAQNLDVFNDLAYELMEKGELKSKELEAFYAKNGNRIQNITDQTSATERMDTSVLPASYNDKVVKTHNTELADYLRVPTKIANLDEFIAKEKADEIAAARQPKKLPILENFGSVPAPAAQKPAEAKPLGPVSCQALFN